MIAERTQTLRVDFGKEPHTEVSVYRPITEGVGHSEVRLDRMVVHEDNPLRRELEHFLARIRRGAPPIGTLDDDLRSLQLATQLIAQLHDSAGAPGGAGVSGQDTHEGNAVGIDVRAILPHRYPLFDGRRVCLSGRRPF